MEPADQCSRGHRRDLTGTLTSAIWRGRQRYLRRRQSLPSLPQRTSDHDRPAAAPRSKAPEPATEHVGTFDPRTPDDSPPTVTMWTSATKWGSTARAPTSSSPDRTDDAWEPMAQSCRTTWTTVIASRSEWRDQMGPGLCRLIHDHNPSLRSWALAQAPWKSGVRSLRDARVGALRVPLRESTVGPVLAALVAPSSTRSRGSAPANARVRFPGRPRRPARASRVRSWAGTKPLCVALIDRRTELPARSPPSGPGTASTRRYAVGRRRPLRRSYRSLKPRQTRVGGFHARPGAPRLAMPDFVFAAGDSR
jgi:hypothetical protein